MVAKGSLQTMLTNGRSCKVSWTVQRIGVILLRRESPKIAD